MPERDGELDEVGAGGEKRQAGWGDELGDGVEGLRHYCATVAERAEPLSLRHCCATVAERTEPPNAGSPPGLL